MWQLRISIVLAFVGDHSQYLDHCVVNALHTTVTAWMVGAGGDLSSTKKPTYDVKKLGAELEAVVRGHPRRRMYRLMTTLAVPSAVYSAAVTANMSARRINRSVKSEI